MPNWEYCVVGLDSTHRPFATYLRPSGTQDYPLQIRHTSDLEEYKHWKNSGQRLFAKKEDYVQDRHITQLLAHGWELHQIVGGGGWAYLFRRPLSDQSEDGHTDGRDDVETWLGHTDPFECARCGALIAAGAVRCPNCATWVGPGEDPRAVHAESGHADQ